jgi:hypothetical protein
VPRKVGEFGGLAWVRLWLEKIDGTGAYGVLPHRLQARACEQRVRRLMRQGLEAIL